MTRLKSPLPSNPPVRKPLSFDNIKCVLDELYDDASKKFDAVELHDRTIAIAMALGIVESREALREMFEQCPEEQNQPNAQQTLTTNCDSIETLLAWLSEEIETNNRCLVRHGYDADIKRGEQLCATLLTIERYKSQCAALAKIRNQGAK